MGHVYDELADRRRRRARPTAEIDPEVVRRDHELLLVDMCRHCMFVATRHEPPLPRAIAMRFPGWTTREVVLLLLLAAAAGSLLGAILAQWWPQ